MKTIEKNKDKLFTDIWNRLVINRICSKVKELTPSISRHTNIEIYESLYQGIGLNNNISIYCEYASHELPIKLYLDHGINLFIVDFNLPISMRGQGTGTRIICELFEVANRIGAKKITLNPTNKRARNFWSRFGFSEINSNYAMELSSSDYAFKCSKMLYANAEKLTA